MLTVCSTPRGAVEAGGSGFDKLSPHASERHLLTVRRFGLAMRWGGDQAGEKSGRILSSIYVNGASSFYNCVDAVVFGFRYEPEPAPS